MAVRVFTDDPTGLLNRIKAAIRDGSIVTWELDVEGDLTHSPEQWKNLAWFRPVTSAYRVIFKILGRNNTAMSRVTYGVYHGRFIEMLLTHFDLHFSRTTATALPSDGDVLPQVKK
jgi:hypothetical protein